VTFKTKSSFKNKLLRKHGLSLIKRTLHATSQLRLEIISALKIGLENDMVAKDGKVRYKANQSSSSYLETLQCNVCPVAVLSLLKNVLNDHIGNFKNSTQCKGCMYLFCHYI